MSEKRPNTFPSYCISSLALGRMVVGAGMILAPDVTLPFFGVPLPAESRLIGRALGGRDLALGILLWTARHARSSSSSSSSSPSEKTASPPQDGSALRTALYAGLFSDVVDLCSTALAFTEGLVGMKAVYLLGGGATSFVLMALEGLQSL